MTGGASERQSRSSERPRRPEPVTIPSRYWHCSAPGIPLLQTGISKSCCYQGSRWRHLCPFEHGTRGRARKFAELWALLAKQEDEEPMIKEAEPMQSKQEQLPDVCRAVDKNESESRKPAWGFSKMGSENLSQNRIYRCCLC